MTIEDVSYNALGCAVWSRLYGQWFQTRWKAPEFAKLVALQGAFAKVILDNADPADFPAEFVLARVAGGGVGRNYFSRRSAEQPGPGI